MGLTGAALIDSINRLDVPAGSIGLWWLGQSSAVIKMGGQIVWLDPYLDPDLDQKPALRRLMEPPVAAEEVTNATVVLLTHDHRDHIDPVTLPSLAKASPDASIIAPHALMRRIVDLAGDTERNVFVRVSDEVHIGELAIIPVPAAHPDLDEDPALGYPCLGYILRAPGVTLYCAGDTQIYDGMVERLAREAIDIALLPINGADYFRTEADIIGNMNEREAAQLADRIGLDTLVPVHWGMFAQNTVRPGHVVSYVADMQFDTQIVVPGLARPFVYTRPSGR